MRPHQPHLEWIENTHRWDTDSKTSIRTHSGSPRERSNTRTVLRDKTSASVRCGSKLTMKRNGKTPPRLIRVTRWRTFMNRVLWVGHPETVSQIRTEKSLFIR
jgi:hypothetical protein